MALIESFKTALAGLDTKTVVNVQLGAGGTLFQIPASELMQALGVPAGTRPASPVPPTPFVAEPPKPATKKVYVFNTPFLRLRAAPTVNSGEVGRFNERDVIVVFDKAPVVADGYNWLQLADGRGWIAGDFTAPGEPLPVMAAGSVSTLGASMPATDVSSQPPAWLPAFTAAQRGVGSSAGGWSPSDRELELVRANRVELVLICAYEANQAATAVTRFRNAGVRHFIIRAAHHGMPSANPQEYVSRTLPVLREYATALGSTQNMMIAVHNEPNITPEGWGIAWRNGTEFAQWYLGVAAAYRGLFPGAKIGFPALSPGVGVPGLRYAEPQFTVECSSAIQDADWIGVHYYWQKPDGSDINPPAAQWRAWFGNRPLVGTEVGPTDQNVVTSAAMRFAYQKFAQIGVPALAFILDGAGAWGNASWTANSVMM